MYWYNFNCRYSKSVSASHFQTSAKTNKGIEELFLEITQQLVKAAEQEIEAVNLQTPSTVRNQGVVIVEDNPVEKKSCCSL